MGKLNIAHHKSYHPYRRDNIERVRRDEEEARLREAAQEGKVMLAVCHSVLLPCLVSTLEYLVDWFSCFIPDARAVC
jgi:hypothetical protein